MVNPLTQLSLAQLRGRNSVKWRTFPSDVLPMFIAEMDVPLAPPLVSALNEAVARGDTGYAMIGRMAEAFSAFAHRRFGWWPDPTPMRLVPDVNNGIAEVLRVVSEPGDAVVFDTPAYPPFFTNLSRHDRRVVENPLLRMADGRYQPNLEGLERAFASGVRVYLLCNPHNPTGTVFTRDSLLSIAELADTYGVRVIADEIHAPITYPGVVHVPFLSLPPASCQRAISLVSASKAWNTAGLKAALAVPGPDAYATVAEMAPEVSFSSGLFGVIAAEAAFTEGGAWLDDLRAGLDHNRQRLARRLAEEVPRIGYRPPDATFLAWLDCRELGLGDDPAEAFLERGRLAVNSGLSFGEVGRGFVRVNIAAAPGLIDEAVRRIALTVETA